MDCAWIFVNGDLERPDALAALIQPGDFLVAADGGLKHLKRLGRTPGLLIGDLDSTDPADIADLSRRGIPVEKHPVEKDETDLELAVLRVLAKGYTHVRIAGALGGRLDMTLGNLFLLALPAFECLDVRLEDGHEEVFLIRGHGVVEGQPGDRVSLLPFGGPAEGVRTEALYYPLRSETLYPERTRGISNVMLADQAGVSLDRGTLICIHTRMTHTRMAGGDTPD
jgi:thiamine pyrophosphokinase